MHTRRDSGTGGGRTILLVDDHDEVRTLTRRLLESLGHEVIEAGGGFEALERCADPQLRLDLLLTDVSMPQMDGVELARRARALRPGLVVLLMSGERVPGIEAASLLKPFDLDELDRAIRSLFEEDVSHPIDGERDDR